jgi:hypothetical protein
MRFKILTLNRSKKTNTNFLNIQYKGTAMSKIKQIMSFLYLSIQKIFGKKKPEQQEKVERNVFGNNGDLEMIEYARMIAFIRTHYRKQAKYIGHIDSDILMIQLSNMSYVEVKALFAAIMEIECQSMIAYHVEKKEEKLIQKSNLKNTM